MVEERRRERAPGVARRVRNGEAVFRESEPDVVCARVYIKRSEEEYNKYITCVCVCKIIYSMVGACGDEVKRGPHEIWDARLHTR